MELKERQLIEVQNILKLYRPVLAKAVDAVKDEDVSNYPVIVVYNKMIELGIPLLSKQQTDSIWEVNISTLEELSVKQLIDNDKLQDFMSLYKRKKGNYCVFVVADFGATFVFIPIKQ